MVQCEGLDWKVIVPAWPNTLGRERSLPPVSGMDTPESAARRSPTADSWYPGQIPVLAFPAGAGNAFELLLYAHTAGSQQGNVTLCDVIVG